MAPWCTGAMSSSTPTTTPSGRARRWNRRSAAGSRQQPGRPCLPEPFAEHHLGVHHLGKTVLVDFYGRDDRGRAGLGLAMAHTVVGILERQPDKGFQVR